MAVQPASGPSRIRTQRGSRLSASTWTPATRPSALLPRPSIGRPSHFIASSSVGSAFVISGFVSLTLSLQQLLGGTGRVDLPLDDAVEQLANRGIVSDGRLQLPSQPGCCQLQDLVAEV